MSTDGKCRFNPMHVAALWVACVLGRPEVAFAQKSASPTVKARSGHEAAESRSAAEITASPIKRERLSDMAELDRIIELYMAGQYQQCSTELSLFLQPDHAERFSDPNVLERGRLYFATCALLLGERNAARLELKAALEENPLMPSPDSLTFPPPLVSLFLEVRDEVQQLIADREREQVLQLRRENEIARRKVEERRRREEQLEKLATQETVIRTNSRFIASLPLGAGQFQNGNIVLGSVFLVGQSLAVVTSITSLAILQSIEKRTEQENPDPERYNSQTRALYDTMKWSIYSALALYVASVVEAQITFKPETKLESRKRVLPPELSGTPAKTDTWTSAWSFSPRLAVLPHGAFVGLDGTF